MRVRVLLGTQSPGRRVGDQQREERGQRAGSEVGSAGQKRGSGDAGASGASRAAGAAEPPPGGGPGSQPQLTVLAQHFGEFPHVPGEAPAVHAERPLQLVPLPLAQRAPRPGPEEASGVRAVSPAARLQPPEQHQVVGARPAAVGEGRHLQVPQPAARPRGAQPARGQRQRPNDEQPPAARAPGRGPRPARGVAGCAPPGAPGPSVSGAPGSRRPTHPQGFPEPGGAPRAAKLRPPEGAGVGRRGRTPGVPACQPARKISDRPAPAPALPPPTASSSRISDPPPPQNRPVLPSTPPPSSPLQSLILLLPSSLPCPSKV